MKKLLKHALGATVLFTLAFGANAATIAYDVDSGVTGNQYTVLGGGYAADSPISVSGSFSFDDGTGLATGSIAIDTLFPSQTIDNSYAADWVIDTVGNTITQSNVVCSDADATIYCDTYAASFDLHILVSGAWSTTPGNVVQFKQFLGGAPFSSSFNAITVSAVPVPGAVWLFGSAIGLLGWKRRRTAS